MSTTPDNLGKYIVIGNHVGIDEYSRIDGSGGVVIGDNTIIAQYFSAHTENHIFSDEGEKENLFGLRITVGKNKNCEQ